jgi:hypothetical protein
VQSEHEPGGVLWERIIRVETGKEVSIVEVIVALDPGPLERPAGEVSHGVIDAGNGEGG